LFALNKKLKKNLRRKREMLLSLFSLTCLLAVHLAKGLKCMPQGLISPKPVQTGNNYAVDLFAGEFPFAYAISYCTATGVTGTYAIYSCEQDGTSITKTTYLKSDCSDDDDATTTTNAVPQFDCSGKNNYVTLEVSIGDPSCNSGVTVYAGLGACVDDAVLTSQIYCNDTGAIVQFFLPYYPPPPSPATTVAPEMSSSSSSMMPEMSSSSSSMMPEMSSSSSSMMPEMSSSSSSMIEEMSSSSSSMMPEMSSSSSSMIEEMSSSSSSMIEEMSSSSSSMIEEMSSSSSMIEMSSSSSMIEKIVSTPALQLCNDQLFCLAWTFTVDGSACQYAGPLPTGALVYGSMSSCQLNVGATNSKKKSASSLVAVINLIVGFAVALFSLF